jgi:hypothetical protein
MCNTTNEVTMATKPKITMPDYRAAHIATVRYTREATREGCEICGTRRKLYVFVQKGKGKKLRCACRKHLRRIK